MAAVAVPRPPGALLRRARSRGQPRPRAGALRAAAPPRPAPARAGLPRGPRPAPPTLHDCACARRASREDVTSPVIRINTGSAATRVATGDRGPRGSSGGWRSPLRGICGNGSASFTTWFSTGDGARPESSRAGPHPVRAVTLRGQARVRAAAGARPARNDRTARGGTSGRPAQVTALPPRARPGPGRLGPTPPPPWAEDPESSKGQGEDGPSSRARGLATVARRERRVEASERPLHGRLGALRQGREAGRVRGGRGAAARVGWDVGSRGADGAAAPQRLGPPRASRRRGRVPSCAPVCPGEPKPGPPNRPHTEAQSTGHSNRADGGGRRRGGLLAGVARAEGRLSASRRPGWRGEGAGRPVDGLGGVIKPGRMGP